MEKVSKVVADVKSCDVSSDDGAFQIGVSVKQVSLISFIGATTLSMTTFSIMTFGIMLLSIMTLSIMAFGIVSLSIN